MLRTGFVGVLAAIAGCYQGRDTSQVDAGTGGTDADTAQTGADGPDGESSGGTDGETDDAETGGSPAGCTPDAVPLATLTRMNRETYVGALQEIFGEETVADLDAVLSAIPSTHGGVFASEMLAPTYAEVAASVNTAFVVATRVTRDDASLANLSSCLPDVPAGADPAGDACLGAVVEDFGRRLLRRPLTDEDRLRLQGEFAVGGAQSTAEGVATLLTALLIDPEFVYFVETRGEEDADGVLVLTPHETAARLARVLWNSIPDQDLLAAADAGLDDATLRAEVERMLDDPRASGAVSGFYRDWLDLERIPFASDEAVPDAEDRAQLREAMADELLAFSSTTVLDANGTYADLILDRTTYIDTPALADIYGVQTSAGPQALPAGERAGLLTRAGFVATPLIRGSDAGHIIKRGSRLSAFICRPLPLPEAGNFPAEDPAEPGDDPTQGIRERFKAATGEATCSACHVQLDGLGAPLGHFGNLGQWIDVESVQNAAGQTVELPIDTTSQFLLDGALIDVSDPLAFSEALAGSSEGPRCLAQNMAQSMLARPLAPTDDCLVEALATALAGDADTPPASVRQALTNFVTSARFRKVRTQ